MSEIAGGNARRTKQTPVRYDEQPEPYQRTRLDKERALQLKRENKILAGKLHEIKREPPAIFHAPQTYNSLAKGGQLKQQREGKANNPLPCTQHYVDVPPWPPNTVESSHITRSREQRRIDEENTKFFNKLSDLYASRRPRVAHNPGGVHREVDYQPPDLNSQWAMRTGLYLPQKPAQNSPLAAAYEPPSYAANLPHGSDATLAALARRQAASGRQQAGSSAEDPGPSTSGTYELGPDQWNLSSQTPRTGGSKATGKARPTSAPRTTGRGAAAALASGPGRPKSAAARVPKTLGLAVCAGCGAKGFRGADGVHLEPCRLCKQVWYCSEVCATVDRVHHEAICKWAQNGHWAPFGRRPAEQSWVANESMAAGLRMLEKRGKATMAAAAAGSPNTLARSRQADTIEGVFDEVQGIEARVARVRAKELAAEARQKAVEDAAYWGLDGPRPCMYMGGKPI